MCISTELKPFSTIAFFFGPLPEICRTISEARSHAVVREPKSGPYEKLKYSFLKVKGDMKYECWQMWAIRGKMLDENKKLVNNTVICLNFLTLPGRALLQKQPEEKLGNVRLQSLMASTAEHWWQPFLHLLWRSTDCRQLCQAFSHSFHFIGK